MSFEFFETDAGTVYNEVMTALTDGVEEPLYSGDERRIFGEAVAMLLMNAYNYLDDKAKQRLLEYAKGEVLDALAADAMVERIPPSPASATFRFELSAEQSRNVVIPQGTRITQDGLIYFATDTVAVINAGNLSVDVTATCETAGDTYNGIEPGQIKSLVDPINFISKVQNIDMTDGGDNGEEYTDEGDDRLRERVRLANAATSTAGPEDAYVYHTLSADASIIDAYVDSPSPCEVVIYPLCENGQLPDQDLLDKVVAVFYNEEKKVRPLTDHVTAKAPTEVSYDIELKYYVTAENEKAAVNLVEIDGGSIDSYIEWQDGVLGRDINPDALRRELIQPDIELGILVERVEITAPILTKLDKTQIARFSGSLKVSHEVIEE